MKTVILALTLTGALVAQKMSAVPGGSFTIGGGTEEDEKPAQQIAVSPFKMDITPVTNAEYNRCVKTGHCSSVHYDDSQCYYITTLVPFFINS